MQEEEEGEEVVGEGISIFKEVVEGGREGGRGG